MAGAVDLRGLLALVGLGNPGIAYRRNRHNLGFMLADMLADRYDIDLSSKAHQAKSGRGCIEGRRVIIAKPQTYMNRSGASVQGLLHGAGLEPRDLIVLHDDLDLPVGKVRCKPGGGHGGHNGLRSIIATLGTGEFRRIKIGIGRPPPGVTAERWVLDNFTAEELPLIRQALDAALAALLGQLADAPAPEFS